MREERGETKRKRRTEGVKTVVIRSKTWYSTGNLHFKRGSVSLSARLFANTFRNSVIEVLLSWNGRETQKGCVDDTSEEDLAQEMGARFLEK